VDLLSGLALLLSSVVNAPAAAAPPSPTGPSAARIAELDYQAARALCSAFYHVVACRDWHVIVSDVRCTVQPAEPGRASCTFTQRTPAVRATQTCSADFVQSGGHWFYPTRSASSRQSQGRLTSEDLSLAVVGPTCSATGAPDAAAILQVRGRSSSVAMHRTARSRAAVPTPRRQRAIGQLYLGCRPQHCTLRVSRLCTSGVFLPFAIRAPRGPLADGQLSRPRWPATL
jgi:hypothetical protein